MSSPRPLGIGLVVGTVLFMGLAAGVLALYHRVGQPITERNTRNVTRRLGSVTDKKVESVRGGRAIYLAQVRFSDRQNRRWVAVGSRELYERLQVGTDLEMDVGQHFVFAEVIIAVRPR